MLQRLSEKFSHLINLEYKWKVLISIVFGIFMIILDSTVVNVAFRTLREEFGAALNESQWIISIYVLALGITTPLSGFFADRFGIKRVYIAGLSIFTLGSLLCGLSPSLGFLIAARALQGFGGGLAQPLGPALLYSTFPPKEQGTALGYFGVVLIAAPALGPILGGALIDAGLWHWIFLINVPIGIVGVTLASFLLRSHTNTRIPRLDLPGLLTAVLGFGAILYAATIAAEQGWMASDVQFWLITGGIALLAFAIIELFLAREPLLDLRLFRNSVFLNASLVGYVTVLALFGAEFLMPLYLQMLRGLTALETGLVLLALASTAAIAAPIAGRLYDKVGPRPLVVTGFSILLVNTWQLSQIEADTSIAWIAFLLMLRGLALGMTAQTTFATALSSVPRPQLARGSSLLNGTRFVVQSLAVAILATVLSSSLSPEVKSMQQAHESYAAAQPPSEQPGLCEVGAGTTPRASGVVPVASASNSAALQPGVSQQQACYENLVGFERAYLLTFFFALLALVLSAFLPGWPFAWYGRGQSAPTPSH